MVIVFIIKPVTALIRIIIEIPYYLSFVVNVMIIIINVEIIVIMKILFFL